MVKQLRKNASSQHTKPTKDIEYPMGYSDVKEEHEDTTRCREGDLKEKRTKDKEKNKREIKEQENKVKIVGAG